MSSATATEILMPRPSDSMEEGTILSWLVAPGAKVTAGQELLEVETDRATMTVEAEASGAMASLVEEGETVPVGTPIATLGGEPAAAALVSEPAAPSAAETVSPTGGSTASGATRRSTPLARRLAQGPFTTATDTTPVAAPALGDSGAGAAAAIETAKGGASTVELSRLQSVIARRMAEAKATVPHFQVETEARMDAAIDLRRQLKEIAGEDPVPSFNDLIVKAVALALRTHPKANASYIGDAYELHERINVGIAVAAEDALVVPTIFDADRKSLGEIGGDSRRLAERVRSGQVTPPRVGRRDLHRLEPRHVRDDRDQPGHQRPTGGDPWRGEDAARTPTRRRWRDRGRFADGPDPQLRPPDPLWGRGCRIPRPGEPPVRIATSDDAASRAVERRTP